MTANRPGIALVPEPSEPAASAFESPLLLTVEQAGRLLNLGRTSVYKLVASGELPAIRRHRLTRIPRAALDEWIARQLADADAWTG